MHVLYRNESGSIEGLARRPKSKSTVPLIFKLSAGLRGLGEMDER